MHPASIVTALLLALGAVEGLAYWWMHPAPTGQGEPVLNHRPGIADRGLKIVDEKDAPAPSFASSSDPQSEIVNPQSSIPPSSTDPRPPTTDNSPLSSTTTPLPEIYDKAAPMLRCSSGQVFHCKVDDTLGLHLAFFEWDGTDTGSVLEAFRHMPEACMGAIGMKLIEKAPPRSYVVRSQGTEDRLSVVGGPLSDEESVGSESPPHASLSPSAANNRPPTTDNVSSSTLVFDHTLFRDPGSAGAALSPGSLVHAFRAVWVSGLDAPDAREGLGGQEFDRLRTIRLKSALTRFRPAHARVIQGAVRGASSGTEAWQIFEQTMLKDLTLER